MVSAVGLLGFIEKRSMCSGEMVMIGGLWAS